MSLDKYTKLVVAGLAIGTTEPTMSHADEVNKENQAGVEMRSNDPIIQSINLDKGVFWQFVSVRDGKFVFFLRTVSPEVLDYAITRLPRGYIDNLHRLPIQFKTAEHARTLFTSHPNMFWEFYVRMQDGTAKIEEQHLLDVFFKLYESTEEAILRIARVLPSAAMRFIEMHHDQNKKKIHPFYQAVLNGFEIWKESALAGVRSKESEYQRFGSYDSKDLARLSAEQALIKARQNTYEEVLEVLNRAYIFKDNLLTKRDTLLENLQARDLLYTIIAPHNAATWDLELYPSSYRQYLLKQLLPHVQSAGGLVAFAKREGINTDALRVFLNTAAQFDTMSEIFSYDTVDTIEHLFSETLPDDLQLPDEALAEAVTTRVALMRNVALRGVKEQASLERVLLEKLEATGDQKKKWILLAIAGVYADFAIHSTEYSKRLREIRNALGIADLRELSFERLFTPEKGRFMHYTWSYFYRDPDGVESYESFMKEAKRRGWDVQEDKNYSVLRKKNGQKEIVHYINKPTEEGVEQGSKEIIETLGNKQLHGSIQRGHTPHIKKHLKLLQSSGQSRIALAYFGACTSNKAVLDALTLSAEAGLPHAVSMTGTGLTSPNNEVILAIHDEILGLSTKTGLVWNDFWKKERITEKYSESGFINPTHNINAVVAHTLKLKLK